MRKFTYHRRKYPCKKTFQGQGSIPCYLLSEGKDANLVSKEELLTSKVTLACNNYSLDPVITSKRLAIPGPGSYEPKINIDKYGIYHLSNIP
jgi:hypothetical protein